MESYILAPDLLYALLYGGVMMLSIVGCVYLLFRRGNAFAPDVTPPVRLRRWAAALLAVMALGHVWWMFVPPSPEEEYTMGTMICAGLDCVVLVTTMMATLLAMLQDRRRSILPILIAMVPVVSAVAVYAFSPEDVVMTLLRIYIIGLDIVFTIFMFFAVRQYSRWLQDNYADLEHKEVRKSLLALTVFMLVFVFYGASPDKLAVQYLVQVSAVLVICLLLWRVETIQQLGDAGQPAPHRKTSGPETEGARTVPSDTGALLEQHCEQAQLYLQHDLTLTQLSEAIGVGTTALSMYFAQQGKTYHDYINGLRIRHFIRLYQESLAAGRSVTAKQLAFESGYRSYSTFGTVFKQSMGQPVTAWMRELAE